MHMDITDRLFVEINPLESGQIPHPHPITEARFDPAFIYKVLGVYNASETSECYFVLANPQRQIWFIPQRHLLAFGLVDSDELFLPHPTAATAAAIKSNGNGRQLFGPVNPSLNGNAHAGNGHAPAEAECHPLNSGLIHPGETDGPRAHQHSPQSRWGPTR